MTVTDQDNAKSIDLAKGVTLIIKLSSNPSTGYSWAVMVPLKLVSSDYQQTDESGKIGAPGMQQFESENRLARKPHFGPAQRGRPKEGTERCPFA